MLSLVRASFLYVEEVTLLLVLAALALAMSCAPARGAEPGREVSVALAVAAVGQSPAPEKEKPVAEALAACRCPADAEARLKKLEADVASVLKRVSEPAPCPMPAADPKRPAKVERFVGEAAALSLTSRGGGADLGGGPVVVKLDHLRVRTTLDNTFLCGPGCVLALDGRAVRAGDLFASAGLAFALTVQDGEAVRCDFRRPVAAVSPAPVQSAPLLFLGGGCAGGQCGPQ